MYLYMYISLVEVCIYVHSASMCPNACAIFLMKRLTSKHQQLDSTGGGPAFSTWGVWDSSSGDKWDSHKMQTRGHKARRFPSPKQINAKKGFTNKVTFNIYLSHGGFLPLDHCWMAVGWPVIIPLFPLFKKPPGYP